jgi:signal transduction histidine kinase
MSPINNPRVLIIDDEADVRKVIANILMEGGYQVNTASSGSEAIDLFRSETFDLVITDMRMPGMDGLEVTRRLKQMDDDLEIIVLTGYGNTENAIRAMGENRAFDYLTKPLENIEDLVKSVGRALEKRRLSIQNKDLIKKLKQTNLELAVANGQLKVEVKERKRMGKALEKSRNRLFQARKMEALGKLVSGVAHEINNPNNFIIFNIPIMKDYLRELLPVVDGYAKGKKDYKLFGMAYPEFRRDLFNLIDNLQNGSERINSIVSKLKEFSLRKDDLKRDRVGIGQVIEEAAVICDERIRKSVKSFDVHIPEDLPEVRTDPEILKNALVGIITNAAQAADKENAWIKINVAMGDALENYLNIEVKDNGCGMDKETMEKIFDPFFTTRAPGEGTGLGLSLCYNLIEALGGRIEVESELGKGSTLRVVLSERERIEE